MDVKVLPKRVYIAPGVAFCAMIFSFEALICLLIIIFLCLIGMISTFFRHALSKTTKIKVNVEENAKTFHFSQGIMDFIGEKDRYKLITMYKEKHAMTGSDDLDSVIEQLLHFIVRDFIDTWYKNLTVDELFQESLLRSSRRSIGALAQCVKRVDWVPFLTRHFIDDLASHLRLYRKSMEKIESQKSKSQKAEDLETIFFDLELEMEKNYCRDLISTSRQYESAYLHDIADILLYLLMPSEDFRSRPLRFLVREILISKVLIPIFDKLSEPEYLTYLIIRLLSEVPLNTDDFITTIETSQNVQELEAVLESIHDEMTCIKSKDSIGTAADTIKQELASLEFAENLIKRQMAKIANQTEDSTVPPHIPSESAEEVSEGPIVNLPITVILTNNVAITTFVEFLNQVGGQNYIDLYLAIDGFKVSVAHQLRTLVNGESIDSEVYETIKEAALFMYHQYLSQEAVTRVPLDDSIINKFLARLRNDQPQDSWFEQIQEKLVEILAKDDRFYPAFKKSPLYIKMLEDLGVLSNDDEDEGIILNGSESSPLSAEISDDMASNISGASVSPKSNSETKIYSQPTPQGPHTSVIVETLGVGQQGKQMFALYNVRVNKFDGKTSSSWNVIRRYSDFHTLNATVQSKYRKLRNLSFPGKKSFNNLDQHFLDRRCKALNEYMTCITQPQNINANPGLESDIYSFLSQKKYTGNVHGFSRKMMTAMFDPILTGVKAFGTAVTQVPESGFVNKVSNELNRAASVLRSNRSVEQEDYSRVAAQLDNIDDENIPLRVMLLLVDEVFGLRGRNQWFRRRLVSVLRQFVHAAMGSSINRRIIDVVQWLTSEDQVLQYLVAFRDSIWPNGHLATHSIQRPASESLRARFLARCLMLTALPDELRLFMGSRTTNIGITDISNALQNRHLNRRLMYVIFERLLVAIFPNSRFEKLLITLHSKSPRMRYT
jgi:sorting nexin-13